MEKSLDESRGNEERGRAQGTEEGERARCRPVEGTRGCRKRWSTASTWRARSALCPRWGLASPWSHAASPFVGTRGGGGPACRGASGRGRLDSRLPDDAEFASWITWDPRGLSRLRGPEPSPGA